MTPDMGIVLVVLLAAIVLFVSEKLAPDLVALLVMAVLVGFGILTVEEGIAGFANPATVTVAGMFVLSTGLFATGALDPLGKRLAHLGHHRPILALLALMLGVGSMSAFINNTAAVAVCLPIVLTVARETSTSPSKLLMPLSFAAISGGTCTVIGTSTNIVVSAIAEEHGMPAFGMFELSPLGMIVFAASAVYMTTLGVHLLPARRPPGDLAGEFELNEYLTELVLLPDAESVGKRLADSPLVKDVEMAVIEIVRGKERIALPRGDVVLLGGDVLRVRCAVEKIRKLQEREGVAIRRRAPWRADELTSDRVVLVEAVLAPNSEYAGKTPDDLRFRDTFGGTILAIRHHGQLVREHLAATPLRAGDALLVEVSRADLARFRRDRGFVVVSEIQHPEMRKRHAFPALAVVAGAVAVAALGFVPIVAAVVFACVAMVAVRCLTLEEAYRAIEWKVVFLLAGVLSLGVALEKTGAVRVIAGTLLPLVGPWGPTAGISVIYLLTSLLTEVMSNIATAALIAPVAIVFAESLGVDARPFLMAVTFAASASFMTPVGYQTNTLVYGPGGYRFADFVRVGGPLNLILWILATLLIPQIWPF